jgi:hypothetical protein
MRPRGPTGYEPVSTRDDAGNRRVKKCGARARLRRGDGGGRHPGDVMCMSTASGGAILVDSSPASP